MERAESKQIVTTGIVLSRTDFQEADRIIRVLTPDHGKVALIAKGVRRAKSKLAGGIELFSVSDLTFLASRSDIKKLISSRLQTHYGNIVKDVQRTMYGYDVIKRVNRITEDAAGPEYYKLLHNMLAGLNKLELDLPLLQLWFDMQLLAIGGYAPNLRNDTEGQQLSATDQYVFDFDAMAFQRRDDAPYSAGHIKLLRLAYAAESPLILGQVTNAEATADECSRLVNLLLTTHVQN